MSEHEEEILNNNEETYDKREEEEKKEEEKKEEEIKIEEEVEKKEEEEIKNEEEKKEENNEEDENKKIENSESNNLKNNYENEEDEKNDLNNEEEKIKKKEISEKTDLKLNNENEKEYIEENNEEEEEEEISTTKEEKKDHPKIKTNPPPSSFEIKKNTEIENLYIKTRENKQMDTETFFLQSRHYFIMSDGGTPIYSRYGDEVQNCSILATFSAIITKFTVFNQTENFVERLNYIANENSIVVFLKKGKIIFIALSKKNDSMSLLYSQLEYLYQQLLSIVTSQRIPILEEKPSSCMGALQDTEQLFEQMIEFTGYSLISLLNAYEVLPIDNRIKISEICNYNRGSALLCCILSKSATEVIAISKTDLINLAQTDMILIQNLIIHSDSLKSSESWVPICLPGISPEGYLQLYCNFTHEKLGIIFVTENQENEYFLKFSSQSEKIFEEIEHKGLMEYIHKSLYVKEMKNNYIKKDNVDSIKVELFLNKILHDKKIIPNGYEIQKTNSNQVTYIEKLGNPKLKNNISNSNNVNNKNENNNTNSNKEKMLLPNKNQIKNEINYNITKDPLSKMKYGIIKHKIYNQFVSINFHKYDKITKEEKKIYKIYGRLYDMYNLQDSSTINLNNFIHLEKDEDYIHAILSKGNLIILASFNIFKPYDEINKILNDLSYMIKGYENNFFIYVK